MHQCAGDPDKRMQIEVVLGDLTTEHADAVVNAANGKLSHGGGLARALARAGGDAVRRESKRWIDEHGSVATGSCAITTAGAMPSRWIVHAVGPVWPLKKRATEQLGEWPGTVTQSDDELAAAVRSALHAADAAGASSIAIPLLSSGIFGFPRQRAARVAMDAAVRYIESVECVSAAAAAVACDGAAHSLRTVRFVNFDAQTVEALCAELDLCVQEGRLLLCDAS